jgi:hypothetical protein
MYGHQRLRHAPHMKLPKRTFKPTRRGETGQETRIVLARRILLVIAPEYTGDTPERLRGFRKREPAGGGKRFPRRHRPGGLDPATGIKLR